MTVQDGRFVLAGQPLAFAGVNFWQAMNLASDGPGGDRAQLLAELDRLHALGVDQPANHGGVGRAEQRAAAHGPGADDRAR